MRTCSAFLRALALPALLLFVCTAPDLVRLPTSPASRILIRNVRVFTGASAADALENADVLLEGERIVRVSTTRLSADGAEIIDGQGKTLLPGLSDCHTHITGGMIVPWKMTLLPTPEFNLQAALYSGITAVWDMGGKSVPEMNALRARVEAGELAGPMIFHSGIAFTARGAHPVPYLTFVRDNLPFFLHPFVPRVAAELGDDNVSSSMEALLADRPDFVKVYVDRIPEQSPLMSDELLKRVVGIAHQRGLPTVFHIGANDNLRAMLDAGGDGAAHNVYKERLDARLAARMKMQNVYVIPTIVAWHNYNLVISDRSFRHYTPLEWETMEPAHRAAVLDPHPEDVITRPEWRAYNEKQRQYASNLYPNLRIMHAAGVTILAGSDAPNYMLAVGGSLHTELQHMVAAGMSPGEALIAATSAPAAVLGRIRRTEQDFGQVREGYLANLLLVNGNPMQDIRATQQIAEVFFRGRRVDRKSFAGAPLPAAAP
ncbi:MAG: amidohydrolase family protein [Leptospirales bacterium]|nr:amidohydrolase family protein [Leptospirales bacterium]